MHLLGLRQRPVGWYVQGKVCVVRSPRKRARRVLCADFCWIVSTFPIRHWVLSLFHGRFRPRELGWERLRGRRDEGRARLRHGLPPGLAHSVLSPCPSAQERDLGHRPVAQLVMGRIRASDSTPSLRSSWGGGRSRARVRLTGHLGPRRALSLAAGSTACDARPAISLDDRLSTLPVRSG